MIGLVDAACKSAIGYLDDETPNTLLLDTGRKVFDDHGLFGPWRSEAEAHLPLEIGPWYAVSVRVDGQMITFTSGNARLSTPYIPEYPVFIWLEVQRTGAKYRNISVRKL